MPIDPSVAIGATLPDRSFSWTESDVLLYHLAIGAAPLHWTLETARLQVLPSFAVVAPSFHQTDPPPLDLPGCDLDLSQVVHGSQSVEVLGPIPTSGNATLHTRITDVWDKGKAAVIWQESTAVSLAGAELWRATSSIFVRGEGGFGGSRGAATAVPLPGREPDFTASYDVGATQALLYRLCGDRNPLHADPAFARAAGFPAPILHGLCTWGIVLRELTEGLLDADATSATSFRGRFSGVVFPGDTIAVQAWHTADGLVAQAAVGGRPVLSDVVLGLAAGD